MNDAPALSWVVSARVTRYATLRRDDGRPLPPAGAFTHSLVSWWLPVVCAHAAYLCEGICVDYRDGPDALELDFLTDSGWLAEQVAYCEYSLGYATPNEDDICTRFGSPLCEVSVIYPPLRAACPGTGTLELRVLRVGEYPEQVAHLQRVRARERAAASTPVPRPERRPRRWRRRAETASRGGDHEPRSSPLDTRERYGLRRDDPDVLTDYFIREAERRQAGA